MSTYYVAGLPYSSELYHHGIKGQKWGVRRYQNEDGTLTRAGAARYGSDAAFQAHQKFKEVKKEQGNRDRLYGVAGRFTKKGREVNARYKEAKADYKKEMNKARDERQLFKAANTNYKRGYRVDPKTGKYDTKGFVKKQLTSAAGGLAVAAIGTAINRRATSEGAKFAGSLLKSAGEGWAIGKAVGTAVGAGALKIANRDVDRGRYDIPTYKKGTR